MWIRSCIRSLVPAVQVALAPSSRQLLGAARGALARRRQAEPVRWISNERDNNVDRKKFSMEADELYFAKCSHGSRIYYVNLKRESGTGSCFVKVSEKDKAYGKRTNLFIGLTDLEPTIDLLGMASVWEASPEPRATLHSKMFDGKVLDFFVCENTFGKSLEIREYYEQGARAGIVNRIYVDFKALELVKHTFTDVLNTAKELWNACNVHEAK